VLFQVRPTLLADIVALLRLSLVYQQRYPATTSESMVLFAALSPAILPVQKESL
jgi:hypothetical protein